MALTTLDPRTALIVIDLQKGIVAFPTAHPTMDIVARAARLAAAFRAKDLPVVLVNVAGGAPGRNEQPAGGPRSADWAELVPELNQQPSDILITKHTWGAFTGTGLDKTLKDAGITQVVICGVATSIGVESDSALCPRVRLQRHPGDRHHDRHERRRPRQQRRPHLPAPGRKRHS